MLTCTDLAMDVPGRNLFKDVSLTLKPKNRYALVGANGAGKSTLLKILKGDILPSTGTVGISKSAVVGILRQDHFRYENYRVIDVVIEGKPTLATALKQKSALLQQADLSERDLFRIAELEETIAHLNGYEAESVAQKILAGLGITQDQFEGPLSALSGGYKLRVLLAQALFQEPDVLLLDEPTNHLDIISIAWLEKYLTQKYQGLLILISHDREFINNTTTHILDIDYQTVICYTGNYDQFLTIKAELLEQKQHELAGQQRRITELQSFVDRFRAKASKAKQAQARLKMIDRIDVTEIQSSSRTQINFDFQQRRPSGKLILEAKELSQAYEDNLLFDNLNLQVHKGQKFGVIGPNGVGKSTLLKTLLHELPPFTGSYRWGETVQLGYFAQDFKELLDPELTLIEWCQHQVPSVTDIEIRKVLGRMLFSGDNALKQIKILSGGECARLIFARLMLEKPNVLILDEPTNHLDMETIESLVEGCRDFPGTVLFVSHNRYFLSEVADHLLVMLPTKTRLYPGSYPEYLITHGQDFLK